MWKGRKSAFSAVGRLSPDFIVQDGVVPRSRLGEALVGIEAIGRKHGIRVANVFHAGDGNLHPLILFDGRDRRRARSRRGVRRGDPAAVHRARRIDHRRARRRPREARLPRRACTAPADIACMKRLQQTMDPARHRQPGQGLRAAAGRRGRGRRRAPPRRPVGARAVVRTFPASLLTPTTIPEVQEAVLYAAPGVGDTTRVRPVAGRSKPALHHAGDGVVVDLAGAHRHHRVPAGRVHVHRARRDAGGRDRAPAGRARPGAAVRAAARRPRRHHRRHGGVRAERPRPLPPRRRARLPDRRQVRRRRRAPDPRRRQGREERRRLLPAPPAARQPRPPRHLRRADLQGVPGAARAADAARHLRRPRRRAGDARSRAALDHRSRRGGADARGAGDRADCRRGRRDRRARRGGRRGAGARSRDGRRAALDAVAGGRRRVVDGLARLHLARRRRWPRSR